MKSVLLILPLAIGLSACVEGTMTADLGPCKPVAITDLPASAPLLGVGDSGFLWFARDVHSSGRLPSNEAATSVCAHLQDDKKPRNYDLHKIGDGQAIPDVILGSDNVRPACPKAHA